MPKKIDPKVKERCVQQMLDHAAEYPNPTAAADVIGKRNGVGGETVRRWYLQAQVDSGQRRGATSEELAEIKELKAKVRRHPFSRARCTPGRAGMLARRPRSRPSGQARSCVSVSQVMTSTAVHPPGWADSSRAGPLRSEPSVTRGGST